jgi:hypothetical protein
MNDRQLTTLWLGAFRYYLGRKTYAVSDFCDLLIQEWDNIDTLSRTLIKKELDDAFERDRHRASNGVNFGAISALGMDCDRTDWQRVKDFING